MQLKCFIRSQICETHFESSWFKF